VVGDDVMDKRVIVLMLGLNIFLFGMWYDMPGIGGYVYDKAGNGIWTNTYQRGVAGFVIALGLSLFCDGVLLYFFNERLGE
jgi:hypothetical protein